MVLKFIQVELTHILMLVDLRPFKVKGNAAAESLSRANITCNKNGIPFDTKAQWLHLELDLDLKLLQQEDLD